MAFPHHGDTVQEFLLQNGDRIKSKAVRSHLYFWWFRTLIMLTGSVAPRVRFLYMTLSCRRFLLLVSSVGRVFYNKITKLQRGAFWDISDGNACGLVRRVRALSPPFPRVSVPLVSRASDKKLDWNMKRSRLLPPEPVKIFLKNLWNLNKTEKKSTLLRKDL